MNIYCAICGRHIESTNVDPLSVDVHSESVSADRAETQHFYCHALCLESVLHKDLPFIWSNA